MTMAKGSTEPTLLTIAEASDYLRLSRSQTYSLAARGELPVVRIGRSVRVRRDKLTAWLDERVAR